ncbi:MAG TPA: hypothetical protein QF499_09070 [Gammaproteobacteria bacterium]|nr:hypothetical protein [Gammaproteobacteria bacterium]MDP7153482.1 hypothetical protein [Gammaproteobacteria bacterium]MDP7660309.1 hypothetical protein [Gammaproteobacteria bacterium]HJP39264.1 hypothetical protein [Gammaproteobacteria bacterium]
MKSPTESMDVRSITAFNLKTVWTTRYDGSVNIEQWEWRAKRFAELYRNIDIAGRNNELEDMSHQPMAVRSRANADSRSLR